MIKDFSISIICKDSTFEICQSEDYSKLLIIPKIHFSIFKDNDLNIFWWRQSLGYSDVTCSLPAKNKLSHHPILMGCMTSSALMYSPAS